MASPAPDKSKSRRSDLTVAIACVAFFAAMIGVTYASVPLYKLFCQVTGYGGTTQTADRGSAKILDRTITVRFDANVSSELPWEFQPKQREVTIKLGETANIAYTAKNLFGTPTRGKASFNVVPELAGAYFNKLECFCFTDTTLKPGETLDMPVVFFVDPEIVNELDLKDIKTITLSYTFFASADETPVAAVDQGKVSNGKLQ
ncbi:MAG: cytochrome c oxidase assembly protein [Rhizobiaceae bacterium]